MSMLEEYNNPAILDWKNTKVIYLFDNTYYWNNGKPGLNGPLINFIIEKEDGTLWACNDNLATQINVCPVTGYEAKLKLK